jgi:hypothetical protein
MLQDASALDCECGLRVDVESWTSRGKHMAEANQNDISESFAPGTRDHGSALARVNAAENLVEPGPYLLRCNSKTTTESSRKQFLLAVENIALCQFTLLQSFVRGFQSTLWAAAPTFILGQPRIKIDPEAPGHDIAKTKFLPLSLANYSIILCHI